MSLSLYIIVKVMGLKKQQPIIHSLLGLVFEVILIFTMQNSQSKCVKHTAQGPKPTRQGVQSGPMK